MKSSKLLQECGMLSYSSLLMGVTVSVWGWGGGGVVMVKLGGVRDSEGGGVSVDRNSAKTLREPLE